MANNQIYRVVYVDSGGERSERLISNVVTSGMDEIYAHCHLREAQRTFKLSNIVKLMDADTGEVIADPWAHFGVTRGPRLPISLVPPIRALKYLTYRLRPGGRKRERDLLACLVEKLRPELGQSKDELDFQVSKLWVGEDGEDGYRQDLTDIPSEWRQACRQTALAIASGSRRKPINPLVLRRIDIEYPASGDGQWAGEVWPSIYEDQEKDGHLLVPPRVEEQQEPGLTQVPKYNRDRAIHIDPRVHFLAWSYRVIPELWPALGVEQREFIDKEKTRQRRNVALNSGEADKANLTRIKVTYLSYVIDTPPKYGFQEGDLFYRQDLSNALQVVVDDDGLEVHLIESQKRLRAFHISPEQLATWLKTGIEPQEAHISRFQSKREIWKFILEPDDLFLSE